MDRTKPMPRDLSLAHDLDALNARFRGDAEGALVHALSGALGPVALVSSFGADSAVLLHMAAQIDRTVPVIFLDTQFLFPETRDYQLELAGRLGLTQLRRIEPNRVDLFLHDPETDLHKTDPDGCCDLRKARPLERALAPYDAWISGRKRFQSGLRAGMEMFERDPVSGKIKINPLAGHTPADLRAHADRHRLPPHPLVARGFASIGCAPCTTPVAAGEGARAGRWRGRDKAECGIHVVDGRILRGTAA